MTTKARKPFKGCKREEMDSVPFPCALSFKIDGIRALAYNAGAMSTSGKPLRNRQVQAYFHTIQHLIEGLDGEIIDGNPWDKNVMQAATTAAMNGDATTEFTYWVFDDFSNPDLPFKERYSQYQDRVRECNRFLEIAGIRPFLRAVEYRNIENMEEYEAMQQEASNLGYEGLYGKSWKGKYKEGRGTPKEKTCWKDKPWTDEEGRVIEVIEMMENTNEAFEDELGRTKRSTAAEGLVSKGYAGSLLVTNPKYKTDDGDPIPFRVSLGSLTMEERKHIWTHRAEVIDDVATYKFFDFGIVDVPRSAIFKCWRDADDITE